jgi:hypothetical protein
VPLELNRLDDTGQEIRARLEGTIFGLIALTEAETCWMPKFFASSAPRLPSHFHSGADM